MSKSLEALEKIDHTICLNNLAKNIVWNFDKEEKCDCENIDQFMDCYDSIEKELEANEILKSHIVEIDNNQDNGDDYYFIAFEKTKEVRELLEKLKEVLCKD